MNTKTKLTIYATIFFLILLASFYFSAKAHADVSYVGVGSTSSTTTSVGMTAPAGTQDNDIMVAFVTSFRASNSAPGNISTPSGWTQWANRTTATYYKSAIYWKRASSESGTYTWTSTNATQMNLVISGYRGCTQSGDPQDVLSNTAYTTSNTTIRAASITPTMTGGMYVWGGWYYASSGIGITAPSGMNSRASPSTTNTVLNVADLLTSGTAASGNEDGTAVATITTKHAYMVALKPYLGTPSNVYYSVGQNTGDLKNGSPSLTVDSSSNANLGVGQTGNIGVGDYIEYGTPPYQKAYITGKGADNQHWTVETATGGAVGVGTTMPINSIKHTWSTLSAAIAGASGLIGTTDLTAANVVLNIPCYYDSAADTTAVTVSGYTTSSTNYIRIYTPSSTSTEANNSQRAMGKWDSTKYTLNVTSYQTDLILITSGDVRIDGLQLDGTGNTINSAIEYAGNSTFHLSNSIIRSQFYTNGLLVDSASNPTVDIWNNIIYGMPDGILLQTYNSPTVVIYNNTIYNCSGYGIYDDDDPGPIIIAKNNIAYKNGTDYSATFNSASTNNLSKDATAPAYNTYYRNKTLTFVNTTAGSEDFHLSSTDTAAIGAGANLTSDSNLPFSTDIDGQTRPPAGSATSWDIGADQVTAIPVYYSVGQNTSDHKTLGAGGSSPTITLSGYTATLSVSQTAPDMGVGDVITYTGGSCYISGKTSSTVWNCQNATGGTAPPVSGVSVTSIAHAFSSLEGAVDASTSNGAFDSSHLNTKDIYTNNYQLNIPCYYDTGSDTTAVMIYGWTTSATNYIKIYTPYNNSTEVNQSQRHSGKWNSAKYNLVVSGSDVITIGSNYVRLDGLELNLSTASQSNSQIVSLWASAGADYLSNLILKGSSGTTYYERGIGADTGANVYVWNSIVYGIADVSNSASISKYSGNSTLYAYNNTVVVTGSQYTYGISQTSGTTICKNNLVDISSTGLAYYGTVDSSSTNNLSKDATSPNSGSTDCGGHSCRNQTVQFISSANKDFHLSPNDTAALGAGANLSADTNLAFNTDIDGDPRPAEAGKWDIGADEVVNIAGKMKGTVKTEGTVKFR